MRWTEDVKQLERIYGSALWVVEYFNELRSLEWELVTVTTCWTRFCLQIFVNSNVRTTKFQHESTHETYRATTYISHFERRFALLLKT